MLQDYIDNELMPVISPITVDSSHPFPFVRNLGRGVVVKLYRKHDKRSFSGLVTLPSQLPRFLTLPRADGQTTVRLIPIFEAIRQALPQLFPQLERQEYGEFQVVQDRTWMSPKRRKIWFEASKRRCVVVNVDTSSA